MPEMGRRKFVRGLGLAAGVSCIPFRSARSTEWPARPITVSIGYGAGGGTDFVARAITPLLSDELDARIKLVNQPGATGSIATDFVWNKPSDGHWWLFSSGFNRGLRATGLHASNPYLDWQFYMADTTIMSVSVKADSPVRDFAGFLDLCRRDPERIRVSNSGIGGSWHLAGMLLKEHAGIDFVDVPYKGGKPAVLACLNGEVDAVTSGLHEHLALLRAGELRNLCVCSAQDLEVGGVEFRSVNHWVPELEAYTPFGGGSTMGLRRDTDPRVLARIASAWMTAAVSPSFVEMEMRESRFPSPAVGAEADRKAALWECVTAHLLFRTGNSKVPPANLGLPPIREFDRFWPPADYRPVI